VALAFALWPLRGVGEADARARRCPPAMALVGDRFCIDRWEGSLDLVTPDGTEPFSPFEPVDGRDVKAVSRPGVVPQAYVSRNDADVACRRSGKRLCTSAEWVTACKGRRPTQFPYGAKRKHGYCNDSAAAAPVRVLFGDDPGAYGFASMNDPRLNQVPGTVAKTGAFRRCTNGWGIFDMVGNVHEWVEDTDGTFRGGYYLDTHLNGDGCDYRTIAHGPAYHDYSTGFRCCADAR
jgi:hypothetical protein